MSCKRHALSHYGITCAKPQHAYHRYIHACICLKHYDLLFKYMNPLSYQIMIFVSLLHPHNPLTFVDTTNFLSCMHTPSSPSPPSAFYPSRTFIFSLGRSPKVITTPFWQTPIDKPLQGCLPTTYTHTFNLLLYVSLPRVSHTVPHTCKLSPLFWPSSQQHLLAPFSLSIRLAGPYLPLTNGRTPTDLPLYI